MTNYGIRRKLLKGDVVVKSDKLQVKGFLKYIYLNSALAEFLLTCYCHLKLVTNYKMRLLICIK